MESATLPPYCLLIACQELTPAMSAASEIAPDLAPDIVFDAILPEGLELQPLVERSRVFKFAVLSS